MKIKSNKEHFLNCNVAGFSYHEGCEVLSQMKVGEMVTLIREDENNHDRYAVAIMYGDTHIGYIPRQENRLIAQLMDLGWGELFEARIQSVDPTAHPENQVNVIIYIKRRSDDNRKRRLYYGYTWDQLLSQCVFYKGEEEMEKSTDDEMKMFWYYEQRWVEFMTSDKNEDKRYLEELRQGWKDLGMEDFCKDDGIDVTLKSLLLNRFIHWGSSLDDSIQGFRNFYLKWYSRKE